MKMSLNRHISGLIVGELVKKLGEMHVIEILCVDATRFKALSAGRGCLADEQLRRISDQTGRAWMRWGVDAAARVPKTPAERRLEEATMILLDALDPDGKKKSAKPRRSKSFGCNHQSAPR